MTGHTFLLTHDRLRTRAQSGRFRENPLPQGNDLRGISFTDANTGTAAGDDGTILRATKADFRLPRR
jgi:hypothetical protein